MDMQYDAVSEELKIYNQFEVDLSSVFRPLMEESTENEDDSDFEGSPPGRHERDKYVHKKVFARINRRVQYFTRRDVSISNYSLVLMEDAILERKYQSKPKPYKKTCEKLLWA